METGGSRRPASEVHLRVLPKRNLSLWNSIEEAVTRQTVDRRYRTNSDCLRFASHRNVCLESQDKCNGDITPTEGSPRNCGTAGTADYAMWVVVIGPGAESEYF